MADASDANNAVIPDLKSMPESILIDILSLVPTIDAIGVACLISPKARDLWSSIPVLSFSLTFTEYDSYFSDDIRFRFAGFIDRTLLNRCLLKPLRDFYLKFDCIEEKYRSRVDAWIIYAVTAKVTNLHLDFSRDDRFDIPENTFFYNFSFSLLKNGCVTVLELSSCILNQPVVAQISSLKTLNLLKVVVTGQMISYIISRCVNLEHLGLFSCNGMKDLSIKSASLTKLLLDDFWCDEVSLDIACPNLTLLRVVDFKVGQFLLEESSALKTGYVWYKNHKKNYTYWKRVVSAIGPHVEHLTVQNWWRKVTSTLYT